MKKLLLAISITSLTTMALATSPVIEPLPVNPEVKTKPELITTSEYKETHNRYKVDSNKDGKVSREEYNAASDRNFARKDANNDGFLNKEDKIIHKQNMKKNSNKTKKGYKKPNIRLKRLLKKADTNNDMKVSKQEYLTMRAEEFAKKDANNDGFITKEERKANRAAHKASKAARKNQQ